MHDGPLADLFRATDGPATTEGAPPPPAPPAESAPPAAATPEPVEPPAAAEPPTEPPAPDEAAARRPRRVRSTSQPERPRVVALPDPEPAAPPRPAFRAPAAGSAAYLAIIRVVGVGGAGVNAVDRMIEADIRGVEFLAVNTDLQQLSMSDAAVKIHIGRGVTEGLGSGSDPEVGRRAAEEADKQIREALRGSDLVFVAAGAGGGTGTGAAPVVARIARELGALTVAIVTTPFRFEGARRREQAGDGLVRLAQAVDTLVTIPNDRLLQVLDRRTSMIDAFRVADDVLRQGVQGICDLITTPGLINLDFADVRTIMKDAGSALMGVGMASGPNAAREAARRAVHSPLIGGEIRGATGILLSVSGGTDLSLHDTMEIAQVVREAADDSANIIFGATVDPRLRDQLWVTVIATGFEADDTASAGPYGTTSGAAARPDSPADVVPAAPSAAPPDDYELPSFLR
jgi:cell division protein FtsZ